MRYVTNNSNLNCNTPTPVFVVAASNAPLTIRQDAHTKWASLASPCWLTVTSKLLDARSQRALRPLAAGVEDSSMAGSPSNQHHRPSSSFPPPPPAPSSSSSPHLHLLSSLPPASLLKGGYRSAGIRSMKTMMMNNDQAAASSAVATPADGLCERVMPHLLHNARREEPDDVWIFWVS